MKRLLSMLLAFCLLLSLSAVAFADDEVDYRSGTPWMDVDLDGNVTEDTPTDLKDNFALAVNKDKILATEIPEGYPYGGTIMNIVLQQAEDLKAMFLGGEPESEDAKLAYHFYQLMMDWDGRNALGAEPLKKQTDALAALDCVDALMDYYLEVPYVEQGARPFDFGVMASLDDASRRVLVVGECPLLLGDSAEYSELTDYGQIKKDAFSELAGKMLKKLGCTEDEAQQKLENCFAFEALLAPAIPSNEEKSRPEYLGQINNMLPREELSELEGKLPILACMEKLGFPEDEDYLVFNPEFLKQINEQLTEKNLPLIRDYLIVHTAVNAANWLDRECYEWANDCDNAIRGSTGMLDDETAFPSWVANSLPWPVAQLYAETYLLPEDKERIGEMIQEILEAYHGILEDADFLSDATRAKAIEKLDAIDARVLYPDSWERYSCKGLEIHAPEDGGSLWQALEAIAAFQMNKSMKEFGEPVDKEEWAQTPQTVNCFYDSQNNSVTILGAFARGVYNSEMSDEELYARLGIVIGHEISHAFDSSGAQFDKDGNMADWWTEEDYAAFKARNEKLAAYYDAMHPWEGQDFYGSIMTGEACADMAGMKVMLRLAADKEDFDYDAFFRAFADIWMTKDSLQRAYTLINDNHPMNYLRINATLQQFDEFLDFYGIREGDAMYLAPEARVSIW